MGGLIFDLRQSVRGFARQPGFTALAVLALAIGVFASTTMFSLVDMVLLRPLPYAAPERLLRIAALDGAGASVPLGPAQFLHLQRNATTIESIGVSMPGGGMVATPQGVKQVPTGLISASMLKTLGITPALGRGFGPAEDYAGNDAVAVITDGFWRREFASDPGVLGRTIEVDRRAVTIVGVLPPEAIIPLFGRYEMFRPIGMTPQQLAQPDERTGLWGFVRMKPGVTPDAAKAELDALLVAYSKTRLEAQQFLPWLTAGYAPSLRASFAAVLFLLLIACANLALLLLMRATARARDLAVRAALGGGRGRIARQQVLEGVLLAFAGGALGLFGAYFAIRALATYAPRGLLPRVHLLRLDWRVAAFAMGASLGAGLLAGAVSAWQAQSVNLFGLLKDGGIGSTTGAGRSRLRDALVVAQLAVALVLASGAGLLVRSMERLAAIPLGIDPKDLSATFVFPRTTSSPATALQLLEAARNTPGVEAAALVGAPPIASSGGWGETVEVAGRVHPAGVWDTVGPNWSTPGAFALMGTRILRGRDFAVTDTEKSGLLALVTQTFVDRYLSGRDPLGVTFQMTGWNRTFTIAGVLEDIHQWGPDQPVYPGVYLPQAQFALNADSYQEGFMVVTKSHRPQAQIEASLRAAAAGLGSQFLLGTTTSLDEYLSLRTRQRHFYLDLAVALAGSALLLAALGVYGAMAFSVVQRRRELAVRATLGARAAQLAALVLGRSARLAAIGTCLGVAGALALSRFLASLLFGVGERDPLTFALVALSLVSVTLAASLIPALAAARQDPMTVLRSE
jgi:putative ABC transport system permease protein